VALPTLLKSALKHGAGYCVTRLGLLRHLHRGRVLLLTYHRVLRADRLGEYFVEPGMYVTDRAFRRQMAFVRARYRVLSMREWVDSWSSGGLSPRGRYCVITFDDGWRDNYETAFPILRDLRLPATVFLATGFIGTRAWFWTETVAFLLMRGDLGRLERAGATAAEPASPWHALRGLLRPMADGAGDAWREEAVSRAIQRLKAFPPERLAGFCEALRAVLDLRLPTERLTLTWDEVREMSAGGIAFGSHTATHAILPGLPVDAVRHELRASQQTLEARGVSGVPVFCYPNGALDETTKRLVQEAGYRAALTTRPGLESLVPADRFAIPRVGLHQDVAKTESLLGLRLIAAPAAPALSRATS
jgi:peptidoglycan/xylan/chitin deacetylase (PgdA/CDA1 family)